MMSLHRRPRRHSSAAFTIVEVAIACTILIIGVLGLSASVTTGDRLLLSGRTTRDAFDSARSMCAAMAALEPAVAFATYNSNDADDPSGAGTAPGPNFTVAGLHVCADDKDGAVGEIVFPTLDGSTLREDVDDPRLGMPRDLDGDGVISNGPPAGTPIILPVLVRVRWRGANGVQELELERLLIAKVGG